VNTILAQISDPHVAVGPGDLGSAEALAAAVRAIAELDQAPDAVLVSGDLANEPTDAAYERVAELLAPLEAPVHLLAGNHDDPDALRARLGAPGEPGQSLQYVEQVGGVRMIALDTTVPGRDDGALGADRLAWLEAQLAEDGDAPTILAMHHPPVLTGTPVIDDLALADSDRLALSELLPRNPQVKRLVAGHVHRGMTGAAGGCPVFVCPSTHLQLALDLDATEIALIREPPCFAVHVATGREVVSHLQPIGDYGTPFT
jgi:3',5'-cyclic AMP phosphodiesterase CpdA